MDEVEEFLSHYGVKGMKWGVRKDRSGVSRRTNREARKDAQEYARAKMFYGQGAGTRRKLIRATVNEKKRKDESYAKAFDQHLQDQDMSRHASKARSERSRRDRTDTLKKSGGFLARQFTGEMGTKAAVTATLLAGGAYLNSPRGRQSMNTVVSKGSGFVDSVARRRGAAHLKSFLNAS